MNACGDAAPLPRVGSNAFAEDEVGEAVICGLIEGSNLNAVQTQSKLLAGKEK